MKREAKIREIFAISDEDSDDDIGHKEEEFVESLLARPSVLTIPTWSVRGPLGLRLGPEEGIWSLFFLF